MAIIAGKLNLTQNGRRLSARGGFKVNPGRDMVEELVDISGDVHGKKKPQPAVIEGTISVTPGLDIDMILGFEDGTAVLEAASGHVYGIRNASYASPGEIDVEEGSMAVRYIGESMEIT